MRILLTGGTGFVGRHLLKKLSLQHEVASVVRNRQAAVNGREADARISIIPFDPVDYSHREKIQAFDPEGVLHLASHLSSGDDSETLRRLLESNIAFGALVLDSIKDTNVRWFINTGSFSEYLHGGGVLNPAYLYAATKTAFRSILQFYSQVSNFKVVNVIPYTIYGGEDSQKKAIDVILDSLDGPESIPMTPGTQTLDFIHVEDVIDFYLHLIHHIDRLEGSEHEFHLGTGTGSTLRELASMAEKISGAKANIAWGAKPFRPRDVMHAVAPVSYLRNQLLWEPKVRLENGLKELLRQRGRPY